MTLKTFQYFVVSLDTAVKHRKSCFSGPSDESELRHIDDSGEQKTLLAMSCCGTASSIANHEIGGFKCFNSQPSLCFQRVLDLKS